MSAPRRSRSNFPVRYVRHAGSGLSRSRNVGIALARAEWIAFIDDDARVRPGWAQTLLAVTRPIPGEYPSLRCDGSGRPSFDDIRALIDQDAAIAARILKISNSALYGFPSETQSLSHAISLLGTMTVRNLVLAASMKETYKRFGLLEKLPV